MNSEVSFSSTSADIVRDVVQIDIVRDVVFADIVADITMIWPP